MHHFSKSNALYDFGTHILFCMYGKLDRMTFSQNFLGRVEVCKPGFTLLSVNEPWKVSEYKIPHTSLDLRSLNRLPAAMETGLWLTIRARKVILPCHYTPGNVQYATCPLYLETITKPFAIHPECGFFSGTALTCKSWNSREISDGHSSVHRQISFKFLMFV